MLVHVFSTKTHAVIGIVFEVVVYIRPRDLAHSTEPHFSPIYDISSNDIKAPSSY
jgi:hypothetical protein